MILYLDTSALIKRYIHEKYSAEVIGLVESSDLVGTSVLAQVEMAAALTKVVRNRLVPQDIVRQSWQDFLGHWPFYTRLNIMTTVLDRAAALAWEHGLRGYDAVHLSAALIWQEALVSPVTLATFDRDLWIAGKKERLQMWPVEPFF
jgi:predicted nucleic acid-binding protein